MAVHPTTIRKVNAALVSKKAQPVTHHAGGSKPPTLVSKKAQPITHRTGPGAPPTVVGRPPAAPAPTTPAPAPGAVPIVQPFLTPAQFAQLSNFDSTYGFNRAADVRKISDAQNSTQLGLSNNQHAHDVSTNNANQNFAARGLFQSSIRAGDLNDLDAQLAMRNNILNTALGKLTTDTNSAIGRLDTGYGVEHNLFNQLAVGNAQAVTPATAAPAPATTPPVTTPPAPHPSAAVAPNPKAIATPALTGPPPTWGQGDLGVNPNTAKPPTLVSKSAQPQSQLGISRGSG